MNASTISRGRSRGDDSPNHYRLYEPGGKPDHGSGTDDGGNHCPHDGAHDGTHHGTHDSRH